MLDDLGLHVDDIIGTIKNGTSEPLDGYTTFLIWLFKFAIILAIIALIVWIIDAIIQLSRSARFDKQYHVTVPGSIRLRRRHRVSYMDRREEGWHEGSQDEQHAHRP